MSEDLIVRQCAPTLAGLKTGNMFTCVFANEIALRDSMRRWNHVFGKKGLRVIPLRFRDNRALVYIYRPARLDRDLKEATASRLLEERGYATHRPTQCVSQLKKRLSNTDEFPHEIGLFLGYPPEDVCGFIENEAHSCKYVGCWKVYGDENAARQTFAKFKKCTALYCAQLAKGRSIERLTVAG